MTSVVGPEIGSQAREVISQYTAQEVYTSREPIQEKIRDNTQKSLGAHLNKLVQPEAMEELDPKHYNDFLQGSIQILDTLVLSIELPPDIVAAINRQTEQFYMIQEFKFRVEREAEESKRKQIEANGIAAFQRTVSQGISDSYLRWRGIEATLALAQSPNSKIVVIGSGKDGLPIILGNVDTPAAPGPPPRPGTSAATPPTEASPAPTDKAPPGPSSPPPSATPPGGRSTGPAPPGKSSSSDTPPASGKMPTADSSAAPASPDKTASSASPLDLLDVESILSRISGALRPSGSAPAFRDSAATETIDKGPAATAAAIAFRSTNRQSLRRTPGGPHQRGSKNWAAIGKEWQRDRQDGIRPLGPEEPSIVAVLNDAERAGCPRHRQCGHHCRRHIRDLPIWPGHG